jgi:ArsR family transcriptional regulator
MLTVFGSGDVKQLSGGISVALITTEFGLILAIPSLVFHALLTWMTKGFSEKMEKVAYILKAIAHPLRIGIIGILMKNEKMCVNDICQTLGSEQSLTSHHLSNMKLNGVLGSSRVGKNIYYHLRLKEVINIIHCMNKCDII